MLRNLFGKNNIYDPWIIEFVLQHKNFIACIHYAQAVINIRNLSFWFYLVLKHINQQNLPTSEKCNQLTAEYTILRILPASSVPATKQKKACWNFSTGIFRLWQHYVSVLLLQTQKIPCLEWVWQESAINRLSRNNAICKVVFEASSLEASHQLSCAWARLISYQIALPLVKNKWVWPYGALPPPQLFLKNLKKTPYGDKLSPPSSHLFCR